jgi:hypothetical protein
MLFNSYPFLFHFLPLALAAYALLRRLPDPRPLLAALLGLSLVFHAAWDWRYVPLLVGSIAANGWIAARIAGARMRSGRRGWLLLGLGLDLGPLFGFEYAASGCALLALAGPRGSRPCHCRSASRSSRCSRWRISWIRTVATRWTATRCTTRYSRPSSRI